MYARVYAYRSLIRIRARTPIFFAFPSSMHFYVNNQSYRNRVSSVAQAILSVEGKWSINIEKCCNSEQVCTTPIGDECV